MLWTCKAFSAGDDSFFLQAAAAKTKKVSRIAKLKPRHFLVQEPAVGAELLSATAP
jgi:hypothetical protein